MLPVDAVNHLGHWLTEAEKEEILEYRTAYYLGSDIKKKIVTDPSVHPNMGWDDERGDYKIITGEHISF